MNKKFNINSLFKMRTLMVCLLSVNVLLTTKVMADDLLKVENPWAKPTFALAKMGAGYFTLTNTSQKDVAIAGLAVAKKVANKVELHETYMEGDMAKMRQLEMPYVIASGASAEFVPKGKHLMIMGLAKPLEKDTSFELIVEFTSGQKQTIIIPVKEGVGSDNEEQNNDHSHHHHH